jgi:hypothetical protein
LWGGLHAFLRDEVIGQNLAYADFVGVGYGGSGGLGIGSDENGE